jgi:hypothetical protein
MYPNTFIDCNKQQKIPILELTKILPTNSYGSYLPTGGSVFGPVQKSNRAC